MAMTKPLFDAHLHNHFDTSKMDSTCKIDKTVKKAKEMGFSAISMNDHGTIAGWVNFAIACETNNIKPIFSVEGYEAVKSAKHKSTIKGERVYFHTNMMAKTENGIKFLRKLVTYSYKLENFYYKPRFDIDFLERHADEIKGNVVWTSACVGGRLPQLLLEGKEKEAFEYYDKMRTIFGEDDTYIEIQNHGEAEETRARNLLIEFAKKYDGKLLATNDVHYLNKEDYISREILIARDNGQTLREREEKGKIYPSELYLKTKEEMDELFLDVPEALENTKRVVDSIEWIEIKGTKWHYPKLAIPEEYTIDEYLRKLVDDNIESRYPINVMSESYRQDLLDRIDLELDVMSQMDASAYMLIDADFTNAAKDLGMRVGKGRGSACGSVVAYIIGITDIEPIKYELYFERFMNPERVSMPDIDGDFQDDRRVEVIDYTVKTHGADKVAQILTFGKIGARMAIRDTGAVLEIDTQLIDKVAKLIPQVPNMTIRLALSEQIKNKEGEVLKNPSYSPELFELYNSDSECKRLVDTAETIEGLIRQIGTHAAGVLISDIPLEELGALIEVEGSNIPVFMGDMIAVDYLKLIKFDFLGLKTLTVIANTLRLIKQNHGIDLDIDANEILEDKHVYELISSGLTYGVFQLEGQGMQSFMRELQPKNIEDIIIGISMYRPGPMDSIPELIQNKKDSENIAYPKDAERLLKPLLDKTYGKIVYQEQCMAIVRDLAGYSFGRSDNLRRAMSKKKQKVMDYERDIFIYGAIKCPHCHNGKLENGDQCPECHGYGELVAKYSDEGLFIKGCIRNGISVETANKIYDDMAEFAKYAFNKSHATAYGELTVQTAYLLKYYPKEYYTAYLNSIITNQDKVRYYMAVVKKQGFEISRPNINTCKSMFACDNEKIYMGLSSLKFVGDNGVSAAIAEREKNGEFKDLQDLLTRVPLNKREVEALIKSGAFDDFKVARRSQMLAKVDDILELTKKDRKNRELGQFSLFDVCEDESLNEISKIKFPEIKEFNEMRIFAMEKEVSGFYLSGHPLDLPEYVKYTKCANIKTIDEFTNFDNKKKVRMTGIVSINEDQREGIKVSKAGNVFANFTLEDRYGTIKVLGFKDAVEQCKQCMFNDAIVEITGNLSVNIEQYVDENDEVKESRDIKIFLNSMKKIVAKEQKKVFLQFNTNDPVKKKFVKDVIAKYPGIDIVRFYNPILKQSYDYSETVDYCDELLDELLNSNWITQKDVVAKAI